MDVAAEQHSLLLWIQSFNGKVTGPGEAPRSLADLSDGVFLARVLQYLGAEHDGLAAIHAQAAGNWALQASNLKTLARAVELFYHDELGQLCDPSELVDVTRIAKESDAAEICRLIELLLGCAVDGPKRDECVHGIMQMDWAAQTSIMRVIETNMHRFPPSSPQHQARDNGHGTAGSRASADPAVSGGGGVDGRHEPATETAMASASSTMKASFSEAGKSAASSFEYLTQSDDQSPEGLQHQLAQALDRASQMEMRCLDAEREKRALAERVENAVTDKQTLESKYATLEEERDKLIAERQSTLTRDNKKIQQIVEGEIHALSLQLEENSEELERVRRDAAERVMVLENEVRRQADELDISRSKIMQLGKLEATVAKYKKKLEEMNSLRSQVNDLETHNAQYLDKVLDLESTVKTIPVLKSLVEKYKNQVVELETANVEAASNNQIKDQKVRRLQEELDSAMGGKEFLESQVEELRAQLAASLHHRGSQGDGMDDDEGSEDGAFSSSRGASTNMASMLDISRKSSRNTAAELGVGEDDLRALASGTGGGAVGMSADVLLGSGSSTSSLRERIARLERENAELKKGGENAEQSHLTSELDMAIKAKEALQRTLFEVKHQNDQLNDELVALRERAEAEAAKAAAAAAADTVAGPAAAAATSTPAGVSEEDAPVTAIEDKADKKSSASSTPTSSPSRPPHQGATAEKIAGYEARINRLQGDAEAVESMRATVSELTNRLKDKESIINELSEQRSKLENYTKKTLHAVQTKYMVAVSSHRNQINEKQERIEFLEKKTKEARSSYSREQALMMSAFYEIGTEMQRRTMMPQTPGQGAQQPAGWLASKRSEERAKRRQV